MALSSGERALVQASLIDADGRGIPSAERLLRAVLLTTPLLPPKLSAAVALQRDNALDPAAQGCTPPMMRELREVRDQYHQLRGQMREGRFLQVRVPLSASECL